MDTNLSQLAETFLVTEEQLYSVLELKHSLLQLLASSISQGDLPGLHHDNLPIQHLILLLQSLDHRSSILETRLLPMNIHRLPLHILDRLILPLHFRLKLKHPSLKISAIPNRLLLLILAQLLHL